MLIVPYAHHADSLPDPKFKVYNLNPALLTAPYFLWQCHELAYDSNQIIGVQETIVEHFDVYEHWLLTGELLLTGEVGEAKMVVPTQGKMSAGYDKLLSCCSLASVLGDDIFLDALVTHLIHLLRQAKGLQSQFIRLLTHGRIEQIIAEAGVGSGFFKLVAHAYARFATVDEIRVLAFSNYNMYFKSQVMQSMAGMRTHQHMDGNEANNFVVGTCHYHTHGFYEACTQPKK
ncbi:hypothetical protein BU25DRAFT_339544 [Macroventuria anomochaeta]|uniref:Uncharacterized protein n=1 Tax=Macroventuria anomochaeta TaxID=301207 RepID=A0ACB6S2S2_9PLEO|nr:uncharacterized protein BU25DRAFT_339544 [Macroventuria anomochaeta]KAF2628566.1 hypothetical protein BU25DRAFT_339544 [Macroventuria anomochaeta]